MKGGILKTFSCGELFKGWCFKNFPSAAGYLKSCIQKIPSAASYLKAVFQKILPVVCYLKGDMKKINATVKIHHFKKENDSILTFGRISCVIKIFLNRQKIVKGRIFLRIPWKGRIFFCHIIGIVLLILVLCREIRYRYYRNIFYRIITCCLSRS